MFWLKLKEQKAQLVDDINLLTLRLHDLKNSEKNHYEAIDGMRKEIESLNKERLTAKHEALYRCAPMLDLKAMRAFSVERMYKEGFPVTVVGYLSPKDEIKEWTVRCSEAQHAAIVNELRLLVPIPE